MLKYRDRHQLNPKRFEDLVGGVFKDFGYRVRVTSGIYITTSDFTKGARTTAKRLAGKMLRIDLWNANAFFDKLELAQRPRYTASTIRNAPFYGFLAGDLELPFVRTHYVYNGRLDEPEQEVGYAPARENESDADTELGDLFKAYLDSKRRQKDATYGKYLLQSKRGPRGGAKTRVRKVRDAAVDLGDAVYGFLQFDPAASPDHVVKIFGGTTNKIGKRRTVNQNELIRSVLRANKKVSPIALVDALSLMGIQSTPASIKKLMATGNASTAAKAKATRPTRRHKE